VATVQFHLINTSILFISREGFRRGCLRVDQGNPNATRRVLRIASLTLPVGFFLAAIITGMLLRSVGADNAVYSRALAMQGEFGQFPNDNNVTLQFFLPVASVQVWQLLWRLCQSRSTSWLLAACCIRCV
jgi:hypothetical protein